MNWRNLFKQMNWEILYNMDTEKWFRLLDEWSQRYLDLRDLSHNEKLCIAICLGVMEDKKEEELRAFAEKLIYSSKINSNALSDAGFELMKILNQGDV